MCVFSLFSLFISIVTSTPGNKTDSSGDDQAEVSGNTITARIGKSANFQYGGGIPVNSYEMISFQVEIQLETSGVVHINASGIGGSILAQTGYDIPSTWNYDLILNNTLCLNPSLICDQEGAINATCDGSTGAEICTCPGNYTQVNRTCQCKKNVVCKCKR